MHFIAHLAQSVTPDDPHYLINLDWPAVLASLAALGGALVAFYRARKESRTAALAGRADVIQSMEESISKGVERGMKLHERIVALEDELSKTRFALSETNQKLDSAQDELSRTVQKLDLTKCELDRTTANLSETRAELDKTKRLLEEAQGVIDSQREFIECSEEEKADVMAWAEELVGQLKEAKIEPKPFVRKRDANLRRNNRNP